MQPVEKLYYDENSTVRFNTIKRFNLNQLLHSVLMITSIMRVTFLKCQFLIFFSLLEFQKRRPSSHGKRPKGNDKRKKCAAKANNTSLNDLSTKLREHGRHAMLSFLCSLPIPVVCILAINANRFYVRNHQMYTYEAALLTRCYTKHALRPLNDFEINHKKPSLLKPLSSIKEFTLLSIFQDKSVTSSIPCYFQNSGPPIIRYKYNKPIRNIIFNFISFRC